MRKAMNAPDYTSFIHAIEDLNTNFLDRCGSLINSVSIQAITGKYTSQNVEKKAHDDGFNIFTIISDSYKLENFHSDLISHFLNPDSQHGEGSKFLGLFIKWLSHYRPELKCSRFRNAVAERESGKIDILIWDRDTKDAVIIENKINGAPDMERQLPRYLDLTEERDLNCKCIVYLQLAKISKPETRTWSDADRTKVHDLLFCTAAYDSRGSDLINNWLTPCIKAASNADVASVLMQYKRLISKLANNAMNRPVLEQFYNELLSSNSFSTAQAVCTMMAEIPALRAQLLLEKCRESLAPFTEIGIYQKTYTCFNGFKIRDMDMRFHVVALPDQYRLQFWNHSNPDDSKGIAARAIADMGLEKEYVRSNGIFTKHVNFPDSATDIVNEVKKFQQKLSHLITI